MENQRIEDFLQLCCRVCLSVENVMVDTTDAVENYNITIDELLHTNADMKRLNDSYPGHPKLICEECFSELLMVAKFREKCAMAEKTLLWLIKTTNARSKRTSGAKIASSSIAATAEATTATANDENIEYVECITDTIGGHYMIIENDEVTTVESNDIIAESVDEHIVTTDVVEESIEECMGTEQEQEQENDEDVEEDEDEDEGYETSKVAFYKNAMSKTIINHNCELCGAGFAQENNLLKHMQTHENSELIFPEQPSKVKLVDESSAKHKRKNGSKKEHSCEYCSKSFCAQSLLQAHVRTHTNERPFNCKVCTKTFKTRGALDLHTRRHSGVKPYKCHICDRGFVESSNLKVHMRVHTGEKPHACKDCGRAFSRVFLLQIHQRTHTGERPYVCTTCSRSFAQQSDLRAHIRIHSGERPHKCLVCAKGFIRSSGLTQHMRRHRKGDSEHSPQHETTTVQSSDTAEVIIEDAELSKNDDLTESMDSSNVIVCYKTYAGYDDAFTEYLKDDNSIAE